jgi:hypothetical protein
MMSGLAGMAQQAPGLQMLKGVMGGGEQAGGAQQAGGAGGAGGIDQLMQIVKMLIEALKGGQGAEKSGEAGGKDSGSPCSQSTDKLAGDKGSKGKAMDEAGAAGGDVGSLLSQLPAGTTITIGGGQ